MYCCLPFSYAVKYRIIKIDLKCIEVRLSLKPDSNLSETEKEKISNTPMLLSIKVIDISGNREGVMCNASGYRGVQKIYTSVPSLGL
jgi:hypothetical protein